MVVRWSRAVNEAVRNEPARLQALHELAILDSAPEPSFDDLATLAAEICDAPYALITLLDERRQWAKARVGLPAAEIPRAESFCAHALGGPGLLMVRDATADPRHAQAALVRGPARVRFYAGAPLVTAEGHVLGTLCVMDRVPRELTARQQRALRILAQQVMTELELRRAARKETRVRAALAASEERWQFALEGSEQGVWDWNIATNEVFFSARWCTMLGYQPDEIPGRMEEWSSRVHPDDLPGALAHVRQHLEGHTPLYVSEHRMRARDGSWRWILDRGRIVARDHANRPLRMVGTHTDVTARKQTESEIAEARRQLETLLGNLPGMVYRCRNDERWTAEFVSDGVRELTGYPATHFTLGGPMAMVDLMHPEDRARISEEVARALAERRPFEVTYRIRTANGEEKWLSERGEGLPDLDGQVRFIEGFVTDITATHTAIAAVHASEERFRLLAHVTNDAVWDWDVVGGRLYWNEGYETLFGYRREDVPPGIESWTNFIHPDDLARVKSGIEAVLARGCEWQDHYRFRHRDGRYLHVYDRGAVIRDGEGRAIRMVGGMTDLTEREQAEAKLREQAALIDHAHDAIVVRDCEQRITYWNRAAERLYGWSAAEALGRNMQELLKVEPARFDEALRTVFAAGAWNGELQKTAKDGTVLTVEGSWSLQRDSQGQPLAILTIDTDITERRNLEQQFLRAQRMESIGTLAGGIAHDLNNLLAPITMGIELLRRNETNPKSQLLIDNIERSAKRGAALIKQVLSFARGVEGSRVPLQLKHIVREIQSIVDNTFPKNITFDAHVPPDLWNVVGDPTQLNQVLLNLCVNGRDALPEGGHLRLEASNIEVDEQYAVMNRGVPAGHYVVIEVIDNGVGIPREIIDRIFEPFFTTKQMGQGTGLGLSTVLGIVRSHGGFVNVYSEPGKGSTFKVYLPAEPDAVAAEPAGTPEERLPRGNGELILVVDDEAPILNVTRQSLEAFGYRVLTAEDGAQAIGLYASHQPEIALVLTDMMMPVMDGPALIAALRRMNPHVRIIAASGLSANADVARALRAGVKHFLPKPYPADTMLMLLKQALAGPGSRSPM